MKKWTNYSKWFKVRTTESDSEIENQVKSYRYKPGAWIPITKEKWEAIILKKKKEYDPIS